MPNPKCPSCGSYETQDRLQDLQCRACGNVFGYDRKVREIGPDQTVRDRIEESLKPRATVVMGNINDLIQTAGDAAAASGEHPGAPTPEVIGPTEHAERPGLSVHPTSPGADEATTATTATKARKAKK